MTTVRMAFSGKTDGPLAGLTAEHPGLLIEGTPVSDSMLLRCSGDHAGVEAFVRSLSHSNIAHHVLDDREEVSVIARPPPDITSILASVERSDLLLLPPVIWSGGLVHVRILSLHGGIDAAKAFPQLRLEAKTTLRQNGVEKEVLSSGLLLPSLTAKQGHAVLAALDGGYYKTPRGSTAGEIAKRLGVARSTFEEHLKAAEAQIMGALAPLVRVRLMEMERGKEKTRAEALQLYSRFSEDLGLYVNLTLRAEAVTAVSLTEREPAEEHGADHPYLARIIEHLSTGRDDLRDVPLDLPVTGFEREVLELLRTIPPGEVMTYGEIARRLGRPQAMRAVGNACAKNPAIVVVPCHRVVPSSGGIGNYSGAGGQRTKIMLLEKEGAMKKVKGPARKRSSSSRHSH